MDKSMKTPMARGTMSIWEFAIQCGNEDEDLASQGGDNAKDTPV